MSCSPLVSVIMPTFNHGRYLRDAIQSVLNQENVRVELIVIDDGSTDDTPAIAASFGDTIQYHRLPKTGAAAALNHGLCLARGEFIAFLDSDDLWLPGKLAAQLCYLEENPECSLCFGRMRHFLEPGHELPPCFTAKDLEGSHEGIIPSLVLVRAAVFKQAGAFNTGLQIAYDVDWFARVRSHGFRSDSLADLVLLKRLHGTNLSSNLPSANREIFQTLRAAARRNRENSVAPS